MKRALSLAALVGLSGCATAPTEKTYERMLVPLMSETEQAEYYRRQSWPERKAYLYEAKLIQHFLDAPPAIRQAVLEERVLKGMLREHVLMSWGRPAHVVVLRPSDDPQRAREEGRRERWFYDLFLTPNLDLRGLREVSFTNGVVIDVRDDRGKRPG